MRVSDPPDQHRGSKPYLPPPPDQDDFPESVHFPRHEPPPASLEAMVRSRPGSPLPRERSFPWLWLLALAAGVAVTAYILGMQR